MRCIKPGKQLVHNNKKLHIYRFIYKFPFCFLLKFFHSGLYRSCIRQISRIKPQHFKIGIVFQEVLSVILIADRIRAQFALVRRIGGYDGTLFKVHLLENLIILTGCRNEISHKNSISITIHETRLHIEVLDNIPCHLFKTGARTVYLLHRAPFLLQLCPGS